MFARRRWHNSNLPVEDLNCAIVALQTSTAYCFRSRAGLLRALYRKSPGLRSVATIGRTCQLPTEKTNLAFPGRNCQLLSAEAPKSALLVHTKPCRVNPTLRDPEQTGRTYLIQWELAPLVSYPQQRGKGVVIFRRLREKTTTLET